MRIEELSAYELLEKREIPDISSTAYRLRHKKTGARIALLSNEDENKVFYIGFRTPPEDSTGVAHILEHSTLCGSRDFPVKDPFVELVKGSLNTFLNAMTYPDKTMYPVASCNDKDFRNLMHVYLDAVFYPNVYDNESIFRQEGWHYEFDEEDNLIVNGVVYNEMKGALSSPEDILSREIMNSLYPDTCYGVESGGDPEFIPDLTYEQFLDFHRAYYHPSNSYIYLYGNMDMVERLEYLDREYLSKFEPREVDSTIGFQKPFEKPVHVAKACPLGEGENADENTFLSLNVTLKDSLDRDMYLAFQILDYALCSAPGAPLKKALVERGIGKDVYSSYENGILQPYFSIVAKDTQLEKEEAFLSTIREVLEEIVKNGFDKKSLLAGINHYEFRYREADFGEFPKGLMLGLQCMDSWLYDDEKPFVHIEANDTFARLRKLVESDYFEKLVETWILQNPHRSVVTVCPKEGVEEEREEKLRKRLEDTKKNLTEAELEQIRETFRKLREFQEQEDSKENLAKLPLLTREDLKREALPLTNREVTIGGAKGLWHDINTNGIGYLRLAFSMDELPEEYYPYAALLKGILALVDTEKHTYGDLNSELDLATGGFGVTYGIYSNVQKPGEYAVDLELKTKYLYNRTADAMALAEEVLFTSKLRDYNRILEVLEELRSQMQGSMLSYGHQVAFGRLAAAITPDGVIREKMSGLELYRFVSELVENYESRKEELASKLEETAKMVLRPENLFVDFTGEKEGLDALEDSLHHLCGRLYDEPVTKAHYEPKLLEAGEGLMTSGQVQYVCRAGDFRKKGLPYTGALRVLRVLMGYDYLWVNIRVKGGAYGCMSNFSRTGVCSFATYRDPHLKNSIKIFEEAPEAIASWDADERGMTQLIIGTFSDMDTPLTPSAKGSRSYTAYKTGLTIEDIQKERNEVLDCTPENIRALSAHLKAFLEDDKLCVVGNSNKIKENKDLFRVVSNLL